MRRRALIVLPLALAACRDDVVDPADVHFEPLCGEEDGPVELLVLADDEEVGWVDRVGDEGDLLVLVGDADESPHEESSSWRRHVVVDRCGDAVTDVPSRAHDLGRWGDVLVGCVGPDLVRLASYDDPSPEILARRGCGARLVGDRWVAFDVEPESGEGRLLSFELAGTGLEARVLVEDLIGDELERGLVPGVLDDRVLVQTADLAVHGVDPRTGEVTRELEAAEPGAWSLSAEASAHRPPIVDPDDPGPIVIRDRRTGAEQTLDAEIPASWSFWLWGDGMLVARPPGTGERLFRLDPLGEVVPPEGTRIETVGADGLVWLSQFDESTGEHTVLRWREGETPQPAVTCQSCGVHSRGYESVDVLVSTPHPYRYDLWRLDDAGGPARLLANGVGYHYLVLDDDRVLTVQPEAEHGPLLLFEGSGGPAVTLAPRANARSSHFTSLYGEPGEIVYEAIPHQGTHALLRARLSP